MASRRRPPRIEFAVGVETSGSGADVWLRGRPYRLHVVVSAGSFEDAESIWRRSYGTWPDICISPNPAHVDVVRLRQLRSPC